MTRIVIIQGHPDPAGGHFDHALADAYAAGASAQGHGLRRLEVARLDFPLLRTQEDYEKGDLPEGLVPAQEAIAWAEHLVLVYPLWLGDVPALLKGFLEQVLRPSFAFDYLDKAMPKPRLKGRSAQIVVTMGMPAIAYRWFYRAHSLKSLKRNVLGICGIGPIRESVIGMVEQGNPDKRRRWLERMEQLGAQAR